MPIRESSESSAEVTQANWAPPPSSVGPSTVDYYGRSATPQGRPEMREASYSTPKSVTSASSPHSSASPLRHQETRAPPLEATITPKSIQKPPLLPILHSESAPEIHYPPIAKLSEPNDYGNSDCAPEAFYEHSANSEAARNPLYSSKNQIVSKVISDEASGSSTSCLSSRQAKANATIPSGRSRKTRPHLGNGLVDQDPTAKRSVSAPSSWPAMAYNEEAQGIDTIRDTPQRRERSCTHNGDRSVHNTIFTSLIV